MRKGEFPDGAKTLRAKIDMAHPNLNMRDPIMYRIVHETHHRQGDKWCIYPMYDWAHGFEDSIERITHSICTLEFENHRPLYDWFIDAVNEGRTDDGSGPWGKKIHHPQQIEFARLSLTYTVMSKRKLLKLVKENLVRGWDDPRMPTISGMRRRGYSPSAMWSFAKLIGVNKFNSTVDIALLEHCLREDLNKTSPRVMAVLRPLKVVIDNYPEGQVEELDAVNNPGGPGRRHAEGAVLAGAVHRAGGLHGGAAEEVLPAGPRPRGPAAVRLFHHLHGRREGRRGKVVELHCLYDPATRGGDAPDGRKVKATLHWVCAPGTPGRPRSGSTTTCSPRRTRKTCRRARTSPPI